MGYKIKNTIDIIESRKVNLGYIAIGDSRDIELIVTANGIPITFSKPEFELHVKKYDGNFIRQNTQIKLIDNKVEIELWEQILTSPGITYCELLIKDNGRTTTSRFYFICRSTLDNEIIDSIRDVEILDDLDKWLKNSSLELEKFKSYVEVLTTNNISLEALLEIKDFMSINLEELKLQNIKASKNNEILIVKNNEAGEKITELDKRDLNLVEIKEENIKASTNTTNLDRENTEATTNISNLDSKNNAATNNVKNLDSKNTTASANIKDLDSKNNIASSNITGLNTENTNARTNLEELHISIEAAKIIKEATDEIIESGGAATKIELDKTNAQLEDNTQYITKVENEKLGKNEMIPVSRFDKNLGKFDETYFTDELIAKIAGTAGVNVIPSNMATTYDKLARLSIYPENTQFLKVGKNKCDNARLISGFFINTSNGVPTANASYTITDFIPVEQGVAYTNTYRNTNTHYAFYDKDKRFVSTFGTNITDTFICPSNCYFVRFTIQSNIVSAGFQIEEGSAVTPYERYEILFNNQFDIAKNIKSKALTVDKMDSLIARYEYSKNMFNKNTSVDGKCINWNNGTTIDNASWVMSDYIQVGENVSLCSTEDMRIASYTGAKAFISAGNLVKTYATPTGTKFVRVSFEKKGSMNKDSFQMEVGTTPTSYIDFGLTLVKTVDGINVATSEVQNGGNVSSWKDKVWISYGDSITQQGMWQTQVLHALGLTHTNKGIGGTKVSVLWDSTEELRDSMCTDTRIATLPSTLDLLTFMGATNDWANNCPLGDINSNDIHNFYGAMNTMTEKLLTKYTTDRILYITPVNGSFNNRAGFKDSYTNSLGLTVRDYCEVIINICKKYSIPYLDLNIEVGFNKFNFLNYYLDESGNFIHPKIEGGNRMAENIIGKLRVLEPLKSSS